MILPDKNKFSAVTQLVIDTLEGGYFHPKMYQANPGKFALYKTSGETLFGLDRHAGHDLFYSSKRKSTNPIEGLKYIDTYTYKNAFASEFWETIDKYARLEGWKWNTRGGKHEGKLKALAASIMYPEFLRLAKKYLTESSQKIVYADDSLLFHFIYATWNGEGFFKYYAKRFNQLQAQKASASELLADQIQARRDSAYSTIRKSAVTLEKIFNSDAFKMLKAAGKYAAGKIQNVPLLFSLFLLYFIFSKKTDS